MCNLEHKIIPHEMFGISILEHSFISTVSIPLIKFFLQVFRFPFGRYNDKKVTFINIQITFHSIEIDKYSL